MAINLSQFISVPSNGIGEYYPYMLLPDSNGGGTYSDEVNGYIRQGQVYLQTDYPQLFEKIGLINSWKLNQTANSSSSASRKTSKVSYENGLYIAGFEASGSIISTSTNLSSWSESGVAGSETVKCTGISYGNSLYVASFHTTSTLIPGIRTSTNGTTWTDYTGSTYTGINSVIFANGNFTYNQNSTLKTTSNFTSFTTNTPGISNITTLRYINSKYLLGNESGEILISTDGTNWTTATSVITSKINDFIFAENYYVVAADEGQLGISIDGLNWSLIVTGITDNIESLEYQNGKFIFSGPSGSLGMSDNGIDWYLVSSGTTSRIKDLFTYTNGILAAAYNGYGDIWSTSNINQSYSDAYDPATEFYVPSIDVNSIVVSGWDSGYPGAFTDTYIRAK